MSSKWEREIEELLHDKFEDKPRPLPRRNGRPPRRRPDGDWRGPPRNLSPERLMLYGLGLAVASYLLRPLLGGFTVWLALVSVGLIAASLVLSVMNRESPYVQKRWRGEIIQLPRQQSWLSYQWRRLLFSLRRWLGRY